MQILVRTRGFAFQSGELTNKKEVTMATATLPSQSAVQAEYNNKVVSCVYS